MKKKSWKRYIKYVVLLMIVGLIAYAAWPRPVKKEYITEKVARHDVEQTVSVTGTVESDQIIELRFQKPGKIDSLPVKVGDVVKKDELLAKLDSKALQIQADQAKAGLLLAQSNLNLKLAGLSGADLDVFQKTLDSAQIAYESSQTNLDIARKSAAENEKKAQLAVQNAQTGLNNATTAVANAEKQVANSQKQYENAQKQYENALKSQNAIQDTASQGLVNAYQNARTIINVSLLNMRSAIPAADAVLGKEQTYLNDNFQNFLGALDSSTLLVAGEEYFPTKQVVSALDDEFGRIGTSNKPEDVELMVKDAREAVLKTKQFMSDVYKLLNATIIGGSFTQANLDALKSSILAKETLLTDNLNALQNINQTIINAKLDITNKDATSSTSVIQAQTSLDNAKSAIDTANTSVDSAKSALDNANATLTIAQASLDQVQVDNEKLLAQAQSDVDLKKAAVKSAESTFVSKAAAPRKVDIAGLQSQVSQAQSAYDLALQNLNDLAIQAPTDGTITQVNREIGENVTGTEVVIAMVSPSLQIKANVSETDIAKVKLADKVTMTFDALSIDDVFDGTVASIDPAETVVQGVIYYQITVSFDSKNSTIKPGMTANLNILTEKRPATIAVSPQAVQYKDNKPFVRILQNNIPADTNVELGLQGSKFVEILSGVEEGQDIVLYEKK